MMSLQGQGALATVELQIRGKAMPLLNSSKAQEENKTRNYSMHLRNTNDATVIESTAVAVESDTGAMNVDGGMGTKINGTTVADMVVTGIDDPGQSRLKGIGPANDAGEQEADLRVILARIVIINAAKMRGDTSTANAEIQTKCLLSN